MYNIRWSRLESKENYLRQRGTLHNDENVITLRKHNNPKYVWTKQQSCKVHEAKTDRPERQTHPQ